MFSGISSFQVINVNGADTSLSVGDPVGTIAYVGQDTIGAFNARSELGSVCGSSKLSDHTQDHVSGLEGANLDHAVVAENLTLLMNSGVGRGVVSHSIELFGKLIYSILQGFNVGQVVGEVVTRSPRRG